MFAVLVEVVLLGDGNGRTLGVAHSFTGDVLFLGCAEVRTGAIVDIWRHIMRVLLLFVFLRIDLHDVFQVSSQLHGILVLHHVPLRQLSPPRPIIHVPKISAQGLMVQEQ